MNDPGEGATAGPGPTRPGPTRLDTAHAGWGAAPRPQGWVSRLAATRAPAVTVVIRFAVGATFLSEGVQKFVFPDRLGAARFAEAGIPAPGVLAPLDGVFEIGCGLLILAGLATRAAAIPMIVNMLGALAITKLPILWGGSLDQPDAAGFFDFAHEARTDVAMLAGLVFLLVAGAGRWSLDARAIHHSHAGPAATRSDPG